jgi:hypothetical protein
MIKWIPIRACDACGRDEREVKIVAAEQIPPRTEWARIEYFWLKQRPKIHRCEECEAKRIEAAKQLIAAA